MHSLWVHPASSDLLYVSIYDSAVGWMGKITHLCTKIARDSGNRFYSRLLPNVQIDSDNGLLMNYIEKIDTIVKKAHDYLEWFYNEYGETVPKRISKTERTTWYNRKKIKRESDQ